MKISSLVKCALAFLFGALALTPHLASAQTTNVIFNYTNKAWDFHARSTAPLGDWKAPAYVPTGWSNGVGVFSTANEADRLNVNAVAAGAVANTILNTNGSGGGGYVITYYYRTKFNFTNDPVGATLIVSNMVDEGAVFYINGSEVQRIRMPAEGISHTTYATDNAEVANENDTFVLPANFLVQGENTIAVEVHQYSPIRGFNSSDSVFGLALSVVLPAGGPPRITANPVGARGVDEGTTHTFTVQAQGSPPLTYQWLFEGEPIQGANSSSYTIQSVTAANEGGYSVIVSNNEGTATSSTAFIEVNRGPILSESSVWKYWATGAQPPLGWQDLGFNDASWLSGAGAFGTEGAGVADAAIRTPIALTNSSGAFITTMYFRNTFTFDGNPSSFFLSMSNLVDDGIILYLNGTEIYRLNMSPGTATATTTSSDTVGDAAWIAFQISTDLLRVGTNVIAAEVHQANSGSSDIVFGLTAQPVRPTATFLAITQHPESQTVEEGKTATFRVEYSGGGPNFQWYKDSAPILGANRNFLIITNLTLNDAGSYHVVLNNAINTVQSQPATLNVIADTNPPVMLRAMRSNPATNIVVSFSEVIDLTTATNLANFQLRTAVGGSSVTIAGITLFQGTNVVIRVASPLQAGVNYLLTVNNVKDASPSANLIVADSQIAVGAELIPVPFDASWYYYQFGDNQHQAAGQDWRSPSFNNTDAFGSPWIAGPGVFKRSFADIPGPTGDTLTIGFGLESYLFRNHFVLDASPAGAQLLLRYIIDDGAVFYLNGVEFLRVNMPGGDVTHNTTAIDEIGNAGIQGPFQVPLHLLRNGTNVFAVEVHQHANGYEDVVFGAELQAIVASFIGGPISITKNPENTTVVEGETAVFDVGAVSASTFQWFRNGQQITGATNAAYGFVARTNDNGTRYSVRVGNTNNQTLTSTEGTLTVIPDTTRPVLLTATGLTNMTGVIITFSEPVEAVSATTLANYTIRNGLGAALQVVGASVSNATTIVLTTSTRNAEPYFLRVNNITDTAAARNRVVPDSGATISYSLVLMPNTAVWRFLDSADSEPAGWNTIGFDDSFWRQGAATIGEESADLPWDIQTPVNEYNNARRAYYFRGGFNLGGSTTNVILRVRQLIDDGVVVYLNGAELYRTRIPAGEVTHGTVAQGGNTEGQIEVFSITNAPLQIGTNYVFATVHQQGNTSSDVVFAIELGVLGNTEQISGVQPPPAPLGVAATAGPNRVNLSWQGVSGATTYHIKRSTNSGSGYTTVSSVPTTSFTDGNLTAGTTYYYVVSAENQGGEGNNSVQVSATPFEPVTLPGVPAGLTAVAGNAQVRLSWLASANATSYVVKRSTASNGIFSVVASNLTSLSYTNTGLVNENTYWFRVSGVNAAGEGTASVAVSATPTTGGTTNNLQLSVTRGSNAITINWQRVVGDFLQSSTNVAGPWTTFSSAAPPITAGTTNTHRFFRVHRP